VKVVLDGQSSSSYLLDFCLCSLCSIICPFFSLSESMNSQIYLCLVSKACHLRWWHNYLWLLYWWTWSFLLDGVWLICWRILKWDSDWIVFLNSSKTHQLNTTNINNNDIVKIGRNRLRFAYLVRDHSWTDYVTIITKSSIYEELELLDTSQMGPSSPHRQCVYI